MAKRKGRLLSELSLIQRVSVGKGGLTRQKLITPTSPIVLHRRGLMQVDYQPPDPREQYAVPDSEVHGTLPERIFYKALTDMHLTPGSDFTFQSSLTGGRIHLGGMVCDFLFERPPLVVRIQGMHWHGQFDRVSGDLIHGEITQGRRDDEQGQELNQMGYAVVDLWEDTCYDPFLLKDFMAMWIEPMLVGVG
jgi:hypothetical protein